VGVTAHTVRLTQDLRRLADDLQRSREALVKGREEERRRLRRDLHDELGPQLASLKLNLDVARNLVLRDPKAAEALLVDLRTQSQSAIADIRRLVYDLRPPALDELGFAGAIQEYTRQIGSQDGLHLRFQCPKNLPPLPAAAEVAAYRITLEALANVVRHSQGQNCSVSISVNGKHLLVEICDDGQGIAEDAQPGVGLNSMRERAAELGGSCTIETLSGGGTRVLAQLPLA
jgi:signal transduction histidine kinase